MDDRTCENLETYILFARFTRNSLIPILTKEQAVFNSLTEDLQKTEDGMAMYAAIKNMYKAVVCMDEAIEAMETAKDN